MTTLGYKFTEKAKEKMRERMMGNTNSLGYKHTEEAKKRISEANTREKHPNWKGGYKKNNGGYILFKMPKDCRFFSMGDAQGYVLLHRLIMAKHLQRPLTEEEVVHHENGDVTDNRRENLKLFKGKSEHTAYHEKLKGVNCADI